MQREMRARAVGADVARAHVGRARDPVRENAAVRLAREIGDFEIIDAEHRDAVERQPMQEIRERLAHAIEIARVVLEMIGIDVRDDRDHRRQQQERAVGFIRFGDEILARTEARVSAGGNELAADDECGIEPGFGEHACGQRGRRRLAVRARDRDAAPEAHELAEHFRARHDRNAARTRGRDFGVVGFDRARCDEHVDVVDVLRVVALVDARAERGETARRRVLAAIGARYRITEIAEHFGDAAHADAADADEMHAAEVLHDVAVLLEADRRHAATSIQMSAMRRAASGLASVYAASAIFRSFARSPISSNAAPSRFTKSSPSTTSRAPPAATIASALRVW